GRVARPGAEHLLATAGVHRDDALHQFRVHKRTLFETSAHFVLLRSLPHDELVRRLSTAGLLAHRDLAPLGLGLAADGSLAFATAVRMVARVHGRAAHRRAESHVPRTASLADRNRR